MNHKAATPTLPSKSHSNTSEMVEMFRKKPMTMLGLLVVVVSLFALLIGITVSTELRNRAATETKVVELVLEPGVSNIEPGSSANIQFKVNTQAETVDGFQLKVLIQGAVPQNITFQPASVTGLNMVINQMEDVSGGKELVVGFITANPTSPFTTSGQSVSLGSLSFTAPAQGEMNLNFDANYSKSTRNQTGEDLLKDPLAYTYNFTAGQSSEPITGGSLKMQMVGANQVKVGQTFEVDVIADTDGHPVSGVDAIVNFNPTFVKVNQVVKSSESLFSSYPQLTFDNTQGKIYLSANIGTSQNAAPVSGQLNLGRVTLEAVSQTASTYLNFDMVEGSRNDSNIVLFTQPGEESQDILSTVSNLNLVINPQDQTEEPVEDTEQPVTVKLTFQGRNRASVSQVSDVVLTYQNMATQAETEIDLTTSATGEVSFNMMPGSYKIKVSAPGYLARRFGTTSLPITIGSSTNYLDFSVIPLLGGDFNGDGVVNEIDYTLHFLPKFRTSDTLVDLDRSAEVNNLDFAIMRSNWGLVSETW